MTFTTSLTPPFTSLTPPSTVSQCAVLFDSLLPTVKLLSKLESISSTQLNLCNILNLLLLTSFSFFGYVYSLWDTSSLTRPGIEPLLPEVKVWIPNHWTARKVPQETTFFDH